MGVREEKGYVREGKLTGLEGVCHGQLAHVDCLGRRVPDSRGRGGPVLICPSFVVELCYVGERGLVPWAIEGIHVQRLFCVSTRLGFALALKRL